jgi:hypothetical protein
MSDNPINIDNLINSKLKAGAKGLPPSGGAKKSEAASTGGLASEDKAVMPTADGKSFVYNRVMLKPTGLVIPENMSSDEWKDTGTFLFRMNGALQWWLGDWLKFGEDRHWRGSYEELAAQFNYDVKTLYNLSSVARKIEISLRKEILSFGHHVLVAYKSADEQIHWLNQAEENNWSISELRRQIKALEPARKPRTDLAAPEHKQVFTRVWQEVKKGKPISRNDMQYLRDWLSAVEQDLGYLE